MLRPVRVLFAFSVAALTLTAAPAFASGGPTPDVVHATVAPGSHTDPKHSYYVIDAQPGATITQQVLITNPNDHPVIADVGSVDAWTSNTTGVSYGTPGSTPKSTGTWISMVTPQLRLSAGSGDPTHPCSLPGSCRTIPFTVTVPTNAQPGQYLGALSASVPVPAARAPGASGKQAQFAVTLQPQRIIAVEVVVPGPRAPHLSVHAVKAVVQANALRLQFDVSNDGNAFAKGHGTLTVADTNTRRDFTLDTFVSHTSIKLPVAWTKNVVPGIHQVTLRLQDQNGRVVNWTGSVDVSGATGNELQHELSAAEAARLPHHGGGGISVSWYALLLVPICIAAAVHLHRRRAGAQGSQQPTAKSRAGGATATPPPVGKSGVETPGAATPKSEASASR